MRTELKDIRKNFDLKAICMNLDADDDTGSKEDLGYIEDSMEKLSAKSSQIARSQKKFSFSQFNSFIDF